MESVGQITYHGHFPMRHTKSTINSIPTKKLQLISNYVKQMISLTETTYVVRSCRICTDSTKIPGKLLETDLLKWMGGGRRSLKNEIIYRTQIICGL